MVTDKLSKQRESDRDDLKAGTAIALDKRLEMYRSMVLLRQAEQRANDIFKGTSHLSLGQEAIAAGPRLRWNAAISPFAHTAGTLARGVPVEKVLGELMGPDNGLMRAIERPCLRHGATRSASRDTRS
jgi:acetoin:2,6-dichlorophenolindophenol oxidoreductase subunit alpha